MNNSSSFGIEVDGCLQLSGPKCDYLVISHLGCEHYVELKGSDLRHATDQLSSTIEQLSTDAKRAEKHCFIVSTRCPLTATEIQLYKKVFKKQFNSRLIIKNLYCEHTIS